MKKLLVTAVLSYCRLCLELSYCFLLSYKNCIPGFSHDLIIIHRNNLVLTEEISNKNGRVVYVNKINEKGEDIPLRAFGAYRFAFNLYKEKYDLFLFISDDVIIKRDNRIKDIVDILYIHEKVGFGASQIFNGGKNYPHESHIRAPFWFAKTESISKINREFDSDHDGEMKIGKQLSEFK